VHVARRMRLEPDGGLGGGSGVFHVSSDAIGDGTGCQAL
jgi:hypothetical protein